MFKHKRPAGLAIHSQTSIDLKLKAKPYYFNNEQMLEAGFARTDG